MLPSRAAVVTTGSNWGAHGSQGLVRFTPHTAGQRAPVPMKRVNRRRPAPAVLPAILDLNQAAPLAASLLGRRGSPLVLDGSSVERLGAQCLQVLLAARQTWVSDGQPFRIGTPSAALAEACAAFGAANLVSQVTEASS